MLSIKKREKKNRKKRRRRRKLAAYLRVVFFWSLQCMLRISEILSLRVSILHLCSRNRCTPLAHRDSQSVHKAAAAAWDGLKLK